MRSGLVDEAAAGPAVVGVPRGGVAPSCRLRAVHSHVLIASDCIPHQVAPSCRLRAVHSHVHCH